MEKEHSSELLVICIATCPQQERPIRAWKSVPLNLLSRLPGRACLRTLWFLTADIVIHATADLIAITRRNALNTSMERDVISIECYAVAAVLALNAKENMINEKPCFITRTV